METNISTNPLYEERPWGSFTILNETEQYKVKRIEVIPGARLSYQKHSRRHEHWYVIEGTANITLDGEEILIESGASVDIPAGVAHRVKNPAESGNLVFIEIQTGSYFGEDDIIRLSDDYERQ